MRRKLTFVLFAALGLVGSIGAKADSVADFYRGKTVTVYIGYGPGGGYDTYARLIAKHMPKHLPGNPSMVPSNMPGASSMRLGNHLARVAPRDGTAFGAVNSALMFDPLFAGAKSAAQFKGPDLVALGNIVSSAAVLVAWHTSGVKTMEDVRTKGLTIASTSRSGDTYLLPLSMKNVLGLDKLKMVIGYPGTREAAMALEQGEVQGRVWDMEGLKTSRPDWIEKNQINIVAQLAPSPMPEVPSGVPLVKDFVANEEDKKVLDVIFLSTILARPYLAPPGIPQDRVKALRDAFMATMKDPDFMAECGKMRLSIDAMSGEDMQRVIEQAYALPEATIQKVRKTLED